MLLLPGCGPARETNTVIHGAWLTKDGASLVLLAETGVDTLSRGSLAAVWNRESDKLTVWRLDRLTGKLQQIAARKPPPNFKPLDGPALPEQWALTAELSGSIAQTPLPGCVGALTRCAARRTPEPFVVRDQRAGRDRGQRVIDPSAGVTLQGLGRKVVVQTYALRTPESVDRARGEAFAATAARSLAAARARIAQTLATTGALPTTRSGTITDGSLAGGFEHMIPAYAIEPGGVVTARLEYLSDAPLSLRWTPSAARGPDGLPLSYACEVDQADATGWITGCAYRPRFDNLYPELAYLEKIAPQLAAAAASDAAYQAARRGVTFGVRASNENERLAWVACGGLPGTRVGGCDGQQGDTACTASLPLLCLSRDESLARDVGADLQNHWLAGRLAASVPIRGADVESRDAADARCATQFGRGWRVARWSDNGEGFIAIGAINPVTRMWIDAPANSAATCWAPR